MTRPNFDHLRVCSLRTAAGSTTPWTTATRSLLTSCSWSSFIKSTRASCQCASNTPASAQHYKPTAPSPHLCPAASPPPKLPTQVVKENLSLQCDEFIRLWDEDSREDGRKAYSLLLLPLVLNTFSTSCGSRLQRFFFVFFLNFN